MTSSPPPAAPDAPQPSNGGRPVAARLLARPVDQELKTSFMDYAMSVIVSRALPDVRDGLKPVHRRILFGMHELGSASDKPPKKSARVVGEVLGKFHPHGDVAIYDAMVRMAQDFSLRYPLIEGQGNFGSVDGDGAAHMRYTEARLSRLAEELLGDIEKETVDWANNFDATLQEPLVLPARIPNLLVNGSSGIAVGMATNMAPHNLGEVVDALLHLIDHPEAGLGDLLKFVQGPDFPTGGLLMGRAGLIEAYSTGRGKLVVRGKVAQEKVGKDRQAIIVTELPYQVNKSALLVNMADLVKDKQVEGISDLRDESDRDGMRVVIELKRDANADVVLNQLYAHTQLQNTFGVQNLALVRNRPLTLPLKRLMEEFVEHRVTVVTRRTQYELKKAEERAHILEGLLIALDHIDEVIQLIRKSKSSDEAKTRLIAAYALTEVQSKAVLDTKLARLAQLEVQEVKAEHSDLMTRIARYKQILGSRSEILNLIKGELASLKRAYPSPRRTQIIGVEAEDVPEEHLIAEHDVVITVTHAGYIKRLPLATYRAQGRGGKGIIGTETKEEDFVVDLLISSTHDYMMFFTSRGQVHWLKAYEVPEAGRYSRGKAIVNLLAGLEPGERITASIPLKEFRDDRFVFFATKKGIVKRTVLSDFKNVRSGGIRAINLEDGDELIGVGLTGGKTDVVLARASGKAVRFHEDEVRAMGRTAVGVWGVNLDEVDEVVSLALIEGEGDLLTIKANGRGKRTPIADYPVKHRATQGVITILTEETVDGQPVTSPVVGMLHVRTGDEVMVSTEKGIVIRIPVDTIPEKGRAAQGNWIIRPEPGDRVVTVARIAREAVVEAATGAAAP